MGAGGGAGGVASDPLTGFQWILKEFSGSFSRISMDFRGIGISMEFNGISMDLSGWGWGILVGFQWMLEELKRI